MGGAGEVQQQQKNYARKNERKKIMHSE